MNNLTWKIFLRTAHDSSWFIWKRINESDITCLLSRNRVKIWYTFRWIAMRKDIYIWYIYIYDNKMKNMFNVV